jgi:Tfp pilus assembly protein PilF
MMIRPKTKRRITYLAVAVCLFFFAGFLFYTWRMSRLHSEILLYEKQGMEAFDAQDYPQAIDKLAIYINQTRKRNSDKVDPKALYDFAIARSKVPTKDESYASLAVNTLRQYVALAPDDETAREQLLEMEAPISAYETAALGRANDILADHPDNLTALRAIVRINFRDHKFSDVLAPAKKYTDLNPTDLDVQRWYFASLQQTGDGSNAMRSRADALVAKYPSDPRFMVVKAWALAFGRNPGESDEQRADDLKTAKDLIVQAAKMDPPDIQFTEIVSTLDNIGEYALARDLLSRADAKFHDPQVQQQLIERLWENGQCADLVDRLKNLDPSSPKTPVTLMAYKSLALNALNRAPESTVLIDQLTRRGQDDPSAAAWAIALPAYFKGNALDLKSRLDQYQQASTSNPDNGFIAYQLGDVYEQMDEAELALQSFRVATRSMPSWSEPHARLAMLLVSHGGGATNEAARAADDANLAGTGLNGTGDTSAAIARIEVGYSRLPYVQDPSFAPKLLSDVEQFQQQFPDETHTLPIYVALLAKNDQRDKAIDVINATLPKAGTSVDQTTLINLARVSRAGKLGMEERIYDTIQKTFGVTPALAAARAGTLLQDGHVADGLKLLQDGEAGDAKPEDKSAWDRVICEYREQTHDPGAVAEWRNLGDTYPNDINVQTLILTGEDSAWTDRDFIDRSIHRLQNLTGDSAIAWKIARCRWLLTSNNDQADATTAVGLLNSVISANHDEYRPHVLLAMAYDKLNNSGAALDEWREAANVAPDMPAAQFDYLKALVAAGKTDDARTQFDKLATLKGLSPDMALAASEMIAAQGDFARAESMLLAYPTPTDKTLHDATLAKVYRMENRPDDAAAIYNSLTQAKLLNANTIREAADFFGAQNDMPQARKYLDRLSALQLPAGQRELILADFEEQHGSVDKAAQYFTQAVDAASDNVMMEIAHAGFLIRHHRWGQAQPELDQALTHWPDNVSLKNLKIAASVFSAMPNPNQPLMDYVTTNPTDTAGIDTISALADTEKDPQARLDKLRSLLVTYPNFEPLYELTSQTLAAVGQGTEAAGLMTRAMGHFSQSMNAARSAAYADAAAGRWNDAVIAAHNWRDRSQENPQQADLFIASADLMASQPSDAVDRLTPYVAQAQQNPDDNEPLLLTYAEAQVRNGHDADASSWLLPLTQNSARWRQDWLKIGAACFTDAASAAAWIEQIRPRIDTTSLPEQQALAEAYLDVGSTFNDDQGFTMARDALVPFVDSPAITPEALLIFGNAAESLKDSAGAERAYRRVLKLVPDNAVAENNLADLLRKKGDPNSLNEAYNLATQAVTNHTTDVNLAQYYDTLARIDLKRGQPNDAINAFESARSLQPAALNILIGLASACADNNRVNDAVRYISQIDTIMLSGVKPDPEDQRELDSARDAVRKANARSAVSGADFSTSGK